MVQAVEKVLDFTEGMDFQQFIVDSRTRDAVYHNLIVLGEAASRMPEYYVLEHDAIPWRKMVATRNALVHGYDVIDDGIVWKIIRETFPKLIEELKPLLVD